LQHHSTRKRADFRKVFHDENTWYATKEEKQMTAEQASTESSEEDTAGASFHGVTDWHAIDWQSVNNNVRRLQARIVVRP